jgi:uncharacterized membrane protein YbhN (UPF0104 family)
MGHHRGMSRLQALGTLISLLAVAGVVYWALQQEPPQLPDSGGEVAWMLAAIALYGVNTLIRAERWHQLLLAEGARPARADTYALTVVGYMGNNVLPARAGDAIRVFLMAPRAQAGRRAVLGTLLAERLLDVAVIAVLFVAVGYGILGEVDLNEVGILVAVTAALIAAALGGLVLLRRSRRLHDLLAPVLASTLRLGSPRGAFLIAVSFVVWAVEGVVWMAIGGAVGFGMSFMEGLYLVALASVVSLIPSGPAYAGTQDAAAIAGVKALGGSGSTAVSYVLMLRFVIVVPITLAGIALMIARYGGLARLREARA